jgi:SWIM zinc finger
MPKEWTDVFWETRDGRTLRVIDMTDEHLYNTVSMLRRKRRPVPEPLIEELEVRIFMDDQASRSLVGTRADVWINQREIRSETSNRVYKLSQHREKLYWACSCPGWKAHRKCKHVVAVVRAEALRVVVVRTQRDFTGGYKTYDGKRGSPEEWAGNAPASDPPATGRRRIKVKRDGGA